MTEPPYFAGSIKLSAQMEEVIIRTDIIQEQGEIKVEEEYCVHIGLFLIFTHYKGNIFTQISKHNLTNVKKLETEDRRFVNN